MFNPLKKENSDSIDKPIEDRNIGGMGIHLVRSIMDEHSYKRENDKNILTLIKYL
jgi:anti-sigma regulatory factor (Ser/Thr protein kinase)